MKKVLNISVGGRSFVLDEDAYARLDQYLVHFSECLQAQGARDRETTAAGSEEIMNDLEMRIAELFLQEVGAGSRVVDLALVNRVAGQLGMPDGSPEPLYGTRPSDRAEEGTGGPHRKLYRDKDHAMIAGVCSGLATYFNVDVVPIRIIMLVCLFAGTAGFWIYLILWIAAPKAVTPAQKCEMYGLPVTAENMASFSKTGK